MEGLAADAIRVVAGDSVATMAQVAMRTALAIRKGTMSVRLHVRTASSNFAAPVRVVRAGAATSD
jgi:hypothetical protein